MAWRFQFWRKGGDSNPRYDCSYACFPSKYLKPLGHLSVSNEPSVAKEWSEGNRMSRFQRWKPTASVV